jgi:hypothetical protein
VLSLINLVLNQAGHTPQATALVRWAFLHLVDGMRPTVRTGLLRHGSALMRKSLSIMPEPGRRKNEAACAATITRANPLSLGQTSSACLPAASSS